MSINQMFSDILRQCTEYHKNNQYNLKLVMTTNNYEKLKTWYQDVMTYPTTSLIIDNKEYPINKLYGMNIEIKSIEEGFKVEVEE